MIHIYIAFQVSRQSTCLSCFVLLSSDGQDPSRTTKNKDKDKDRLTVLKTQKEEKKTGKETVEQKTIEVDMLM